MINNCRQLVLSVCFIQFLILCGCAVGNDYKQPDTKMPETWTGMDNNTVIRADAAMDSVSETLEWWAIFKDPVMSSLIKKALEANHDLRMASSRVRQARAYKTSALSGLWPKLDANASYKKNGSGESEKSLGSEDETPLSIRNSSEYESFRAGFDATWELDFFGGKRREAEAAEADIKASEEDKNAVALTVAAEIATDYLNLRSAQDQIEIAKRNIDANKRISEITEKKYKAGLVSKLDLNSSRARVAESEARIPELEAYERSLIYSIGLLTGDGPKIFGSLSEKMNLPPSPPSIPVGLPADLLKRRPDIKKAEAQLNAATARTGSAKADYFPKITLTGDFGYSGNDADTFLNWSSRSWSFGPAVSIPVFNAGRIAANIETKSAIEEQALINYEKTVLTALKDVETALYNYSADIKKHAHLASSANDNYEAAEMSMSLYSAGKINYSRVLDARISQYGSEEALASSNGKLATDIVSIYKSLGGGWVYDQSRKN
ncbi:efflux transporter outer membrane subunit [Desulforegula conservatrix]|uniref:efflux transporter outer membrane subunit n=1 Tax=Desulforegula conservatrix TaxID=153026 RepID=UPI000421EFC6|nr:TolC family protein [Desulforegula conservatrix]